MNIKLKTIAQIGLLITLTCLTNCNYTDYKNTFTYEEILETSKTKNYEDFKVFIETNKTYIENIELKNERTDFDQKCSAYIKSKFETDYEEKKILESYLQVCQNYLMMQSLKDTTKKIYTDKAFIQDLSYITKTEEFEENINPSKSISSLFQDFKSWLIKSSEENNTAKFECCLFIPKELALKNFEGFCYQKFINFFFMHKKNDDNTHGLVQLRYNPKSKTLEIIELHSFKKGLGTKILTSIIFLSKKYLRENLTHLTLSDQNEINGLHLPFYEKFGFEKETNNPMDITMNLDLEKVTITETEDLIIKY